MYSLQLSWLGVSQMPTPGNTIKLNVGLCWNLVELRNLNLKVVNSRNNLLRRGAQIVGSCCCRLPSLNLFLPHHSSPCSPPDPSLTPFFTPGVANIKKHKAYETNSKPGYSSTRLISSQTCDRSVINPPFTPLLYDLSRDFIFQQSRLPSERGDFYQQLD